MRFTIGALILFSGLALTAATDEVAGRWKTVIVDPAPGSVRHLLKPYAPTLEFKVDGDRLTGAAYMTTWPGNTPVSDGKVDGNHITFTLIHEGTGTARELGVLVTRHPEYRCEGTIHGDEMELTVMAGDRKYEMKGTRISK